MENSLDEIEILKISREYFFNLLKNRHDFQYRKPDIESCTKCYVNSDDQNELIRLIECVHKSFKFDHFNLKIENSKQTKIKRSLVEIKTTQNQTIKAVHSFNREHFRKFKCRFLETDYNTCVFNLVLDM